MNLQKLGRQLRREATASPKKALVLGVLVLVAGWFWAPLIWGWASGDDSASGGAVASSASVVPAKPSVATTPPQAAPSSATSPTTEAAAPQQPRHPWQQLVEWMEADPRTLTATIVSDRRDPFHPPKAAVVQLEPEQPSTPQPEELVADITPKDLGLVLSSTIVGTHRRTALINGKGYDEGKTIVLKKDGVTIRFQVLEIHPRHVILMRNGKRFDLKIPSRANPEELHMLGKAD